VSTTSGSGIRDPGSDPEQSGEHQGIAPNGRDGTRTPDHGFRRVAIIHDWLTGMRGGEKVLDAICEMYPEATIYTLVHVKGSVSPRIESHRIHRSAVQRLPKAARLYRQYLPLFPIAIETFDLDRYDLVISSSHCAAKSVIRAGSATHICYCHSPMRYAWDQFDAYFGPLQVGKFKSRILRPVLAQMARWDAATAGRVDHFLANSEYVAGRICRYYNRGSTVVYPPVDTTFYRPWASAPPQPSDPNFLVVSALVPYKRLDIAIEACRQVRARLKIVGRGPEEARLRALGGDFVDFLGWRTDEEIRDLYREATAVLLPGTEDFGMVVVEAQACGTPVVALGAGGACETVRDEVTGVLVREESVAAFAEGLDRVRSLTRDPDLLHAQADRFSRAHFMTNFQQAVGAALAEREAPR
jgi:glycosyltransferase involved in cell wall biosynthesis